MARISIFGDFKANTVEHLNLSGELQYLINNSDICMVNFEAPVHSKGKPIHKSGPNICQNTLSPEWLELHGINAISLANNHTMDFGKHGLEATRSSFHTATIMGAGSWDEAYRIHTFKTKDGFTIGIICCTQCEFGTLTEHTAEVGCTWAFSPDFERCLMGGVNCDFLIVMMHGGIEYMDHPLPEWRETYRKWIDIGADAVIASHPHVPQGWESYKGKPICYSLGNFCFQKRGKTRPHWNESLCCILNVTEPHQVTFEMRPVIYNPDTLYISDDKSQKTAQHLLQLNDVLKNNDVYIQYVDKFCQKLKPHYMNLFSRSGMVTGINMGLIKGVAEWIKSGGKFKKEHALNNIQCESHRWAILRSIKQTL